MAIRCIVLDFDGTFTDVEKEAVPFLGAYRKDFETHVGAEVAGRWDEVYDHIEANPNGFGWEYEGRIVAPSHADPYIMATSTAQRLLDDAGLLTNDADRRSVLDAIYRENYGKAESIFRPEAKAVVEGLLATGLPLFVVTNSHTAAVNRKIDLLAPEGRDRITVYGDAKKYVVIEPETVDDAFRALEETRRVPGLDRPIYLRRGHYYELLRRLREETGVPAEETLVAGDIFELDLALPSALGYQAHLVARPKTPSYERGAVAALPGGAVSEDLHAVLTRFR
ncbi:MAG: HAD family hydrolase [Myxococcota bacterium]